MRVKLKLTDTEIKEAIFAYLKENSSRYLSSDYSNSPSTIVFLKKPSPYESGIAMDSNTLEAELSFDIEISRDHPYR